MSEELPGNPQKRTRQDHPPGDDLVSPENQRFNLPDDAAVVRITGSMVKDYPLTENSEMYTGMGQSATSSSIVLNNIPDADLQGIYSFFPHIVSLTLENINILSIPMAFSARLLNLTIEECSIEGTFLDKWFQDLQSTLKGLTLDGLSITGPYKRSSILKLLSSVQQLSIVSEQVELLLKKEGRAIEPLQIENSNLTHLHVTGGWIGSLFCPNLERLSLDITDSSWKIVELLEGSRCQDTLKELILSTCPDNVDVLKSFSKLEYLKLNLQDRLHRKTERNLRLLHSLPNFKTLEVLCTKITQHRQLSVFGPTVESFSESLLRRLTVMQQNYSMAGTKRLFYHDKSLGPQIAAMKEIMIDRSFIKKFKPEQYQALYFVIGQHARTLTLSNIRYWEAFSILPYFRNLPELILHNFSIDYENALESGVNLGREGDEIYLDHMYHERLPGRLQVLRLTGNSYLDGCNLRDLFTRLSTTLTCIEIRSSRQYDCDLFMPMLRNIREAHFRSFRIFGFFPGSGFFQRNKDTLEILSIDYDVFRSTDLNAFSSLQQLKSLRIIMGPVEGLPVAMGPHFANLEELYLDDAVVYEGAVEEDEVSQEEILYEVVAIGEEFLEDEFTSTIPRHVIEMIKRAQKLRKLTVDLKLARNHNLLGELKTISFSNLEELVLSFEGQRVGAELENLHHLKTLKVLRLRCTIASFQYLSQLILQLPRLTELEVPSAFLSVEVEAQLKEFLETNGMKRG